TGRKLVPAAGTKTSRRIPAGTHQGEVRKPESNGHVAEHAGATALSSPGDETAKAAATTPGTQRKAARSQQAERIFLRLFEALDAYVKSQGIGHVAQDAQFDWGEAGNQELQTRPSLHLVRSLGGLQARTQGPDVARRAGSGGGNHPPIGTDRADQRVARSLFSCRSQSRVDGLPGPAQDPRPRLALVGPSARSRSVA